MIAATFRLELRRSRTLLLWLAVVCAGYAGVMTLFYPSVAENSRIMEDILKIYPKELMAAFGIEGSIADQGTFFNVYIFAWLWPIVAAIAGIIVPTRTVAADLDRGFLELPLATRMSRTRYLLVAIAVQLVVLAVLAAVTIGAILAMGPIIDTPLDAGRFVLAGILSVAFAGAVAAVTTLLAVATLSRGIAGGIVAGGLVAMYLFQTLAKLDPKLDWLGRLSAFSHYQPAETIRSGAVPAGDLALFAGIALACWALAVWAFRRRDLLA